MTDYAEQATHDTDTATETAADAPRRRRVLRGDGLVTPKPGHAALGGHRAAEAGSLSAHHRPRPGAPEPEAFRPAYPGDSETRARLRKMTRTRTRTRAGRDYLLPTGPMDDEEPKWELR
jgi:hypothetical protein